MKCVRPWKLVKTYANNTGHCISERIVTRVGRNRADGSIRIVDGIGKLVDGLRGARIIRAAAELVNDVTGLVVEVDEDFLDVRGRLLCGNLRERAGEDHSTGSKDSKDGGKTHGDEV